MTIMLRLLTTVTTILLYGCGYPTEEKIENSTLIGKSFEVGAPAYYGQWCSGCVETKTPDEINRELLCGEKSANGLLSAYSTADQVARDVRFEIVNVIAVTWAGVKHGSDEHTLYVINDSTGTQSVLRSTRSVECKIFFN